MPDSEKKLVVRRIGFWLVAIRGVVGHCPQCGLGRLFKSYLKQVDHCAVCREDFNSIRADDGPAWLTILIVGHVLAPVLLNVVPDSPWPDWLLLLTLLCFTLVLALAVLPRAKGLFIAILWRMRAARAEKL